MAEYETYTHNGKEYKFRVGRGDPSRELKKFKLFGSSYYKEKQRSLDWARFLLFVPMLALAAIWFGYINSDNPGDALELMAYLAFPYGMVLYVTMEKMDDADRVLQELEEMAENEEYIEAYRAWMRDSGR